MENIIKMVLSIDQKATTTMKEAHDLLEIRDKDIQRKIEAMRLEIIEKAKNDSKILLESTVREADIEAENIRNQTKEECYKLEEKFLEIKDKLENQLFSQIFN